MNICLVNFIDKALKKDRIDEMKKLLFFLVLVLIGCPKKLPTVASEAKSADTLSILYLGNMANLMTQDTKQIFSKTAGFAKENALVIAYLKVEPGLKPLIIKDTDLFSIINHNYRGVLILTDSTLPVQLTESDVSIIDPAGNYLIKNFKFARIGIVVVPESPVSESLYFRYRKNLSLAKARSEFVITFSESQDYLSDTVVNVKMVDQVKFFELVVVDRTPKEILERNFDSLNLSENKTVEKELVARRQAINKLKAETLFDFKKIKVVTFEDFKRHIAKAINVFFRGDFVVIPQSIFKEDAKPPKGFFTIDSLVDYIVSDVKLGTQKMSAAEMRTYRKNKGYFSHGLIKNGGTVILPKDVGLSIFEVIYRAAKGEKL